MKFCPHCGNPVKRNSHFVINVENIYRHRHKEKVKIKLNICVNSNRIFLVRKDKIMIQHFIGQKHTGWLIVLSIIFVLLIAALLYGAYYAYNHYISDEQSHQTTQSQQSNESNQNRNQSTGPSIDVLVMTLIKVI